MRRLDSRLSRPVGTLFAIALATSACGSDAIPVDVTIPMTSAPQITEDQTGDNETAELGQSSTTIDVDTSAPDADPTIEVTAGDADVEVTVSLTGGSVTVGPDNSDRIDVPLGSDVMIVFSADVAEEAHLHGYDLLTAVEPGENAMLMFTADTAGKFELEFEFSGVFIAEFVVS